MTDDTSSQFKAKYLLFRNLILLSMVESPFLLAISLNVRYFYKVLIVLTLDYLIIQDSHVAVVRLILTNHHIKFLTQPYAAYDHTYELAEEHLFFY